MTQNFKNIIGSGLRIILGISILALLLLGIVLFIWGSPGKSNKLKEKYLTIGNYSIGKQQYYNNICSTSSGCLDGKILGFKKINTDIYIYIEVNYGNGMSGDIKFYDYNLFKWKPKLFGSSYMGDTNVTIYDLKDLPKYGYLSNNELKFYSENDLKNLPQEQQNIFKDLEKKPIIIINGVDYTK